MDKEMKQHRYSVLPKDLPICMKRELNEGFQVATTIILCIAMSFVVIILATFINHRVKEFVITDDSNLYALNSVHPIKSFTFCSNSSLSSLNSAKPNNSLIFNGGELGEWMAPKQLWHSMTDEELMWRASMVPSVHDFSANRTPKVAFMFLTKGRLPLEQIWELFFKGHEGSYTIYIHTAPEFKGEPQQSSVFYKRRIPSKEVKWGRPSMIDAERRLLANALLDFSNERFVLLSESCLPLFNFTIIYNYLINSKYSFLGLFDDPRKIGRGRYNKRMSPTISLSEWRKGSQWFEVHRDLAIKIISDMKYYSVFQLHCWPPCYMDEHYLATLVYKIGPEMSANRSVTWTDWSAGGSHPRMFVKRDITVEFLNRIRHESNCTHSRKNDEITTSICFLFARKFHPSTLQPLLKISPGLYGLNP